MKAKLILLITVLLLACDRTAENINEPSDGSSIIMQVVSQLGGLDNYRNLAAISYKKRIVLYDSLENVESDILQEHTYKLQPGLVGEIKWMDKGDTIKVNYRDSVSGKTINGDLVPGSEKMALNTFFGAHFVLFQTFKLLTDNKRLELVHSDSLLENQRTAVIEVIDTTSADQWWHYIDTKKSLPVASLVKHNENYSLIKNLEYDTSTVLKLHRHRRSYFTDPKGNVQYLRAEYYYSDYRIELLEQP